jgi:hypothetical protein
VLEPARPPAACLPSSLPASPAAAQLAAAPGTASTAGPAALWEPALAAAAPAAGRPPALLPGLPPAPLRPLLAAVPVSPAQGADRLREVPALLGRGAKALLLPPVRGAAAGRCAPAVVPVVTPGASPGTCSWLGAAVGAWVTAAPATEPAAGSSTPVPAAPHTAETGCVIVHNRGVWTYIQVWATVEVLNTWT